MRRLLQGWWSPRHRDCPQLDDPPSATLLDLPDAATSALVEYLDTPSLRAVALSCRGSLPTLAETFQSRFMLRLPPDAPRNEVLMRLVQGSSTVPGPRPRRLLARFFRLRRSRQQNQVPNQRPPLRTLATQFAVADTDHAADLESVGPHVHGLLISSNEYTAWPERPFRMDVLGKFTALKRLVIDYAWDRRVDLTVLSASVPQLQELVVKMTRAVAGRLVGLSRLRVLHLEDTNAARCTEKLWIFGSSPEYTIPDNLEIFQTSRRPILDVSEQTSTTISRDGFFLATEEAISQQKLPL